MYSARCCTMITCSNFLRTKEGGPSNHLLGQKLRQGRGGKPRVRTALLDLLIVIPRDQIARSGVVRKRFPQLRDYPRTHRLPVTLK
jgi:hypothetical protein